MCGSYICDDPQEAVSKEVTKYLCIDSSLDQKPLLVMETIQLTIQSWLKNTCVSQLHQCPVRGRLVQQDMLSTQNVLVYYQNMPIC